jgi:hypothetical protein
MPDVASGKNPGYLAAKGIAAVGARDSFNMSTVQLPMFSQSHARIQVGDLQRTMRSKYTKWFVFDTGTVRI